MPFVANVKTHAVPTGVRLGTARLGNKGGVGVSFTLGGCTFSFVTSHLAHGLDGLPRRLVEFRAIADGMANALLPGPQAPSTGRPPQATSPATAPPPVYSVWGGDLNMRVDLGRDAADALLVKGDAKALLDRDQLRLVMARGDAFGEYAEAAITFPPTYKYDPDTDTFDSSTKRRTPSWTDRVLYIPARGLELVTYRSAQDLRTSDHRPVFATFTAAVNLPADAPSLRAADVGSVKSEVCSLM
jgi:phosphatidylinositol-bisphosphatase